MHNPAQLSKSLGGTSRSLLLLAMLYWVSNMTCSCADVLSDPKSRKLYDLHGADASSHQGAAAGKGNAREAWDEFKPFKKENKRTRARDAVRAQRTAAAETSTSPAEGDASNSR